MLRTLIVVHLQLIHCPAGSPQCPEYGAEFHTGPPSQKARRLLIAKQSAARARVPVVDSGMTLSTRATRNPLYEHSFLGGKDLARASSAPKALPQRLKFGLEFFGDEASE